MKDEIINCYDIKPIFSFETGSSIDNELFFCIEIALENDVVYGRNGPETLVSLYSKKYNKEFYDKEDYNTWRECNVYKKI